MGSTKPNPARSPAPLPKVAGKGAPSKPAAVPPPRNKTAAPPPPKPAAAAKPAEAPAKAKKARKPKGPAIDRAVKFAKVIDRYTRKLLRLVGNWSGEATPDQQTTNTEVLTGLKTIEPSVTRLLLDVDQLKASGFNPIEAKGRAITEPIVAGDRVAIKEKHYIPALHGATNDFEVVVVVDKMLKLRPTGDLKSAQSIVPKSQVTPLDVPEGEEDLEAGEPIEDDVGETETDPDSANGDAESDPEVNFDKDQ